MLVIIRHKIFVFLSLTLSEERKLRVPEKRVLKRMFGFKRNEIIRDWRRIDNDELNDVFSPNIIRLIKSRRSKWAGHIAGMGERRGI
jgi:hypothetical protein